MAFVAVLPAFVSDFKAREYSYVAIYLIALLGLNILTGYTGQISLGHGAFMAIGGYTTAILMAGNEQFGGPMSGGMKDLWTLPIAGLVAGLFGLAFGLPGAAPLRPLPRPGDLCDRRRDAVDGEALRGVHGRRLRASSSSARPSSRARSRT